jgi:hypothetical protein
VTPDIFGATTNMTRRLLLAVAIVALSPAAPPSLNGATVSLSANYPTADDVFTNTVTDTVPVSRPKGTRYGARNNLVQVMAGFDVTGTRVTETFLTNARPGPGTFNGPVYKFTGAPQADS